MRHCRFGRFAVVAVLLGASGIAGVSVAPAASAAANRVTCRELGGAFESGFSLLRCDGNTGHFSTSTSWSVVTEGGTITWNNGETTTITGKPLGSGGSDCPAGSTERRVRDTVTADSTGSTSVPHVMRANLCQNNKTGEVRLAPHELLVL